MVWLLNGFTLFSSFVISFFSVFVKWVQTDLWSIAVELPKPELHEVKTWITTPQFFFFLRLCDMCRLVLEKKEGGEGGCRAASIFRAEYPSLGTSATRYHIYSVLTHALLPAKVLLKVAHGVGTKLKPSQGQLSATANNYLLQHTKKKKKKRNFKILWPGICEVANLWSLKWGGACYNPVNTVHVLLL